MSILHFPSKGYAPKKLTYKSYTTLDLLRSVPPSYGHLPQRGGHLPG